MISDRKLLKKRNIWSGLDDGKKCLPVFSDGVACGSHS